MTIEELAAAWIGAKATEQDATEHRRKIEDQLSQALALAADLDGTKTIIQDKVKIKVTGRINRRVDGDKLQDIAAEHGLSDHLGSLFRWKPEIDSKAWKAADNSITRPLLDAITSKPGRPSFSITIED